MELLIPILGHCFPVMASFAKCLPVGGIPEQLFIPAMGNDVVDYRGGDQLALRPASDA